MAERVDLPDGLAQERWQDRLDIYPQAGGEPMDVSKSVLAKELSSASF